MKPLMTTFKRFSSNCQTALLFMEVFQKRLVLLKYCYLPGGTGPSLLPASLLWLRRAGHFLIAALGSQCGDFCGTEDSGRTGSAPPGPVGSSQTRERALALQGGLLPTGSPGKPQKWLAVLKNIDLLDEKQYTFSTFTVKISKR